MTLDELHALCAWWQDRLELRDWYVRVRFARGRHLAGQDNDAASVEWVAEHRHAWIDIRDEDDYRDQFPEATACVPYDAERSLVHELLHLHFAPFTAKDDTPEDVAQEQAINALARSLVRLKREGMSDGEGGESGAQVDQAEPSTGAEASRRDLR